MNGDLAGSALPTALIDIRDLAMEFPAQAGAVRALDSVSFGIYPGEFFSIVGPSGCGKSTLLLILAGIVPATAGASDRRRELPGATDARSCFQQDNLLEWRSVLENVLLPVEIKHLKGAAGRRGRWSYSASSACAASRPLSVSALRRHAAARRDLPRAGPRSRRCC